MVVARNPRGQGPEIRDQRSEIRGSIKARPLTLDIAWQRQGQTELFHSLHMSLVPRTRKRLEAWGLRLEIGTGWDGAAADFSTRGGRPIRTAVEGGSRGRDLIGGCHEVFERAPNWYGFVAGGPVGLRRRYGHYE